MHQEYLPEDIYGAIAHIIEECGEVLAAAGKTQRFGLYSINPITNDPETNVDWLRREVKDLKSALERFEKYV